MTVRVLDVLDGKLVPTEHCHVIEFLKVIMEKFPENYLKVYSYGFYMTCPDPVLNPYFNYPQDSKEEEILKDIAADFSVEDEDIIKMVVGLRKLYNTPTVRAYNGISTMLDRLAKYMEDTPITAGRDGNITALLSAAKNFSSIRESFKGVMKDLEEESGRLRGGADKAYDSQ